MSFVQLLRQGNYLGSCEELSQALNATSAEGVIAEVGYLGLSVLPHTVMTYISQYCVQGLSVIRRGWVEERKVALINDLAQPSSKEDKLEALKKAVSDIAQIIHNMPIEMHF